MSTAKATTENEVQDAQIDDEKTIDLDNIPGNEDVLLIRRIVGLMNEPEIVDGKTTGSGKSIRTEDIGGSNRMLDSEEIFAGESQYRGSVSFELYTPERLESAQRANYGPGPQEGANEIQNHDEMPEPTHYPVSEGEE